MMRALVALVLSCAAAMAQYVYPFPVAFSHSTSYTNRSLAAGSDRILVRFSTSASSIGGVLFRVSAVTTGGDVDVRLYALDSTGYPTGAYLASATVSVASAAWYTATWASTAITPYAAYGIVFEFASYAGQSLSIGSLSAPHIVHLSYGERYDGSTWTTIYNSIVAVWVLDGSGTPLPETASVPVVQTGAGFNSSSTPDERGIACTFSESFRLYGALHRGSSTAGGYRIELYRAGVNVSSVTGALGTQSTVSIATPIVWNIEPGVEYILSFKPSSTTNAGFYWWSLSADGVPSAYQDIRKMYGMANCQSVYRTDGGSWTYDNSVYHPIHFLLAPR